MEAKDESQQGERRKRERGRRELTILRDRVGSELLDVLEGEETLEIGHTEIEDVSVILNALDSS